MRPSAKAIYGPSVYFDVIFFTVSLYDEVATISDIVIFFLCLYVNKAMSLRLQ
jgi:hypothetical protein